MLSLFADCAERAERLRQRGADVVFVASAELSLMNKGFLPGDTQEVRLAQLLKEPDQRRERVGDLSAAVNAFLRTAVAHPASPVVTHSQTPMPTRMSFTVDDTVPCVSAVCTVRRFSAAMQTFGTQPLACAING